MEALLFIFWCLLVIAIPIALIVTGYVRYVRDGKPLDVLARAGFAIALFALIVGISVPLWFIVIFAGAHSSPIGNALDFKGKIFLVAVDLAYVFFGWLSCSWVNWKFIVPKTFLKRSRQT